MNDKIIKNVVELQNAYNQLPKKYQKMIYKLELSSCEWLPHTCTLKQGYEACFGGNVLDFNTSNDLYHALKDYTAILDNENYMVVTSNSITFN